MAAFLLKQEGKENAFVIDPLRTERKVLSDEALRARLQDMQSAGFTNAATALTKELNHRAKKDTKNVG